MSIPQSPKFTPKDPAKRVPSPETAAAFKELDAHLKAKAEAPASDKTELDSLDIPIEKKPKDEEEDESAGDSAELKAARKKYEKMRKDVEARSGKLNYEGIFQDGSITQEVVISPNILTVVFGTITEPQANFAIALARKTSEGDQQLFLKNYALYESTLGLRKLSVCGKDKDLPSALKDGKLDAELLLKRVEAYIVPVEWYQTIGYNFHWFRDRVAKAVEGDGLGNG